MDGFRTDIDKFLGTKSTKLVTEETDGADLYTFKSDYTSTSDLLHGIQDVGERMSEEGSVLLKNNGALPLTKDETQKITLLGFSSYYPVQGGDMGSSYIANTGTDADTVDMVGAFKAKGFGLNQTVADMYEALKPMYKSEVQSWGGTVEYNHITAPSTTGVFSSKEPSQAALDGQDAGWKDSMNDNNVMIVTIARSASENGSYNPGTAGVDPTQNLNQTDPLGLSDDERDLINAAVTAKAANGGKVIVLLNNVSAMEVQEIEDNDGVDAILQVGLPGGYGFYGVADILSGAVSPSGHLTDTYAVKNASAPSAQKAPRIPCTGPKPRSAVRTKTVRKAPLRPTAPPMTPVARPFRPRYHFWAQDWMDGYRNAVPSPAGMLNARKKLPALPPGSMAAAKNPPHSSAVPHRAAHRGPRPSCRKPPMTHPTPNAAMRMPKA